MQVRRAVTSDVPALAALHAATVVVAYAGIFPADATPPAASELAPGYAALVGGDDEVWVAVIDGLVVGEIALVADRTVPAGWRIERFNVHPERQSAGIGSALYRCAVDAAKHRGVQRLNLWVLEANERARAMYEAWGWQLVPGKTLANDPPEVLDVLYELALD